MFLVLVLLLFPGEKLLVFGPLFLLLPLLELGLLLLSSIVLLLLLVLLYFGRALPVLFNGESDGSDTGEK